MERITINNDRYYKVGSENYPSVTSILSYYPKGESFYKWISNVGIKEAEIIRDNAGEQGTNVHAIIERYVKNDIHKYAGTIDLILKINGEIWIIDIKTSNHIQSTYKLQLSAYKHCGY